MFGQDRLEPVKKLSTRVFIEMRTTGLGWNRYGHTFDCIRGRRVVAGARKIRRTQERNRLHISLAAVIRDSRGGFIGRKSLFPRAYSDKARTLTSSA